MGELEQIITEAIKANAAPLNIKQIISGTAVDVGETTCNIKRTGSPMIFDARLNAIVSNLSSYITVYPAENSHVVVGIIENLKTEAVVLSCSEIERIKIKIGEQTLTMDSSGFVFNGGNNKGLVKIEDMVSWMSKVQNDLTTLATLLAAIPVAPNPSGELTGTVVFAPTTPTPTIASFENQKIKQ